jgi:hypothetical protein
MPLQVLNIPIDSKEVNELIDIFQLKRQAEKYQNAMLRHMKEHWGEDLGEEQAGYIDGTVNVVEDGKLVFPFKDLNSEQLNSYITEKIGDFSIYARLWNSTPSEYEIDLPLNIGTTQDEYLVDLSLALDGSFNVKSASIAYDSDEPSHKLLTYWALKQSN